jgi:hypothetical protein
MLAVAISLKLKCSVIGLDLAAAKLHFPLDFQAQRVEK